MQFQGSFNMEHIHPVQFVGINSQNYQLKVSKKYKNSSFVNASSITGHLLIFKGHERKHMRDKQEFTK